MSYSRARRRMRLKIRRLCRDWSSGMYTVCANSCLLSIRLSFFKCTCVYVFLCIGLVDPRATSTSWDRFDSGYIEYLKGSSP